MDRSRGVFIYHKSGGGRLGPLKYPLDPPLYRYEYKIIKITKLDT